MNDRPREKTVAIIPSAGSGRRMGSRKKNLLDLLGRPVLAHTVGAFEGCPAVDSIILVVHSTDVEACRTGIVLRYGFKKVIEVIAGGSERQDSVANGLKLAGGFQITVVHDGARPLVTSDMIERTIMAAVEEGAAIAAVPVKDTIKKTSGGFVEATVDRTSLVSVQTPQAFRTELLLKAFEEAGKDGFYGTDESMLAEKLGVKVKVIEGSYENIKITTLEDLVIAEAILRSRSSEVL